MKTLTIKDLARSEELGRSTMAAVRGGYNMSTAGYSPSSYSPSSYSLFPMPPSYSPSGDSSVHINQDLKQAQQVFNETANGSAFLNGVTVHNNTSQFGQNNALVL
jgi:hypothetical protein